MKRLVPTILLLMPLLGCALFESKATRQLHASPDFKAGYSDGCASAQNTTRVDTVRDEQAFASNPAYGAGWREGASACRMLSMPGPALPSH